MKEPMILGGIKKLSINPNAKPRYRHSAKEISELPDPVEIPGFNILNPPPVPKACRTMETMDIRLKNYQNPEFYSENCKICHYNLRNQATLFEFGPMIDRPEFLCKAFVGVLGTDTRIRCSSIPDQPKPVSKPSTTIKSTVDIGVGSRVKGRSSFLSKSLKDYLNNPIRDGQLLVPECKDIEDMVVP